MVSDMKNKINSSFFYISAFYIMLVIFFLGNFTRVEVSMWMLHVPFVVGMLGVVVSLIQNKNDIPVVKAMKYGVLIGYVFNLITNLMNR